MTHSFIDRPIFATVLSVFLCPTDTAPRTWTVADGVVWYYGGRIYSSL